MIYLLQTHTDKDKGNSGDTDKENERKTHLSIYTQGDPLLQVGMFLSSLYVNMAKAEVGSYNANCSAACLAPAMCFSGSPLVPIPLTPGLRPHRGRRCSSSLFPTPGRTGGLGDDLSGWGDGPGGTCWAPRRTVLGPQRAGERGSGEEPREGRERREAGPGCRFPSGGGLFPTRAGPEAFLCQGVLPAP